MNETAKPGKEDYLTRVSDEMEKYLSADRWWTLRQKLALTCRIGVREGHASGLARQITARTEDPGVYMSIRLGHGFDEISASSLMRCADDLNPLHGDGMPNPATRFHIWCIAPVPTPIASCTPIRPTARRIIKTTDPEHAKQAHDDRHQEKHVNASLSYCARQVLRESTECLK